MAPPVYPCSTEERTCRYCGTLLRPKEYKPKQGRHSPYKEGPSHFQARQFCGQECRRAYFRGSQYPAWNDDVGVGRVHIPLTQGKIALIDVIDQERVAHYVWHAHRGWDGRWYARRSLPYGQCLSLHRFIVDAPDDMDVDHIDNDGLNCTRGNMRLCTHQQNMANQKLRATNRSGYRGVSWNNRRGRWRAYAVHNGVQVHLGYYDDPIEAARIVDVFLVNTHGAYARLNFPPTD